MKGMGKFLAALLIAAALLGSFPFWLGGISHIFGGGMRDEALRFTIEGVDGAYYNTASAESRAAWGLEGEIKIEDLGEELGVVKTSSEGRLDGCRVYRCAACPKNEDLCIVKYKNGWFQTVYFLSEAVD